MISQFEKLTHHGNRSFLVKSNVALALLSVLASCSEHGINQKQKADAIKLAHIKTFTALPELQPYFKEAEKNFKEHFEEATERYYPFDEERRRLLKMEIKKIREIISPVRSHFMRWL